MLVNKLRVAARIGEAIITTNKQISKSTMLYPTTIASIHQVQEERKNKFKENMKAIFNHWDNMK